MLVFDPQWTNLICYYIAPLLSRLSEGNLPPQVYIVTYSPDSRVVVGPFYVAGRFDEANLRFPTAGMMKRNSLDMAALDGYMSIIEVFDDFQKEHKQDLNERFSYHLWHIVVGQHDDAEYHHSDVLTASPGPNWESVHGELTNRNINLSMILTNPCPKLLQPVFCDIAYTHTTMV
ncbi:hypothetical protein DFH94DRAFT_158682 [Russula ochroleuca]|uniref:Uncharacterized protein n=1 Tax=Russula ochroleuca TaxID=152965 RepID=A0A9P5TCX4_9AGAM|nr:hypothetical protein DFH94DRAFT_158682 [Russula ochroleuca]